MKYLTMVTRRGDPKDAANLMQYTLIGDDLSIHMMAGNKLMAALNDGKVKVTNMAVSSKGLVSTNGAIDKYTTFDANSNIIGKERAVILNRIEVNGKLTGYIVFSTSGIVTKVTAAAAAEAAANGLIANGKIRHTAEGDIVASIGGTYPLLEATITNKADKQGPTVDTVYFGNYLYNKKQNKYCGLIVTSTSSKVVAETYRELTVVNTAMLDKMSKIKGMTAERLNTFKIKQWSGAGFYGIYPIEVLEKLKGISSKFKHTLDTCMIGCTDYDSEDFVESIVVYDNDFKSVVMSQPGSPESDKVLKAYVAEVKEKF